ncbi:hypothetical protein ACJX0J_013345, partial [Zea mays]
NNNTYSQTVKINNFHVNHLIYTVFLENTGAFLGRSLLSSVFVLMSNASSLSAAQWKSLMIDPYQQQFFNKINFITKVISAQSHVGYIFITEIFITEVFSSWQSLLLKMSN